MVAWADRLIAEDGAAGVPQAFDLCTLGARHEAEAITLLRQVGDAADAAAVGRAVCAWIADRLAADEITATHAARLLKRLMLEGFRAGPDFEDAAYYFDDAVDLAPTIGPSLDQLRVDLLAELREITS